MVKDPLEVGVAPAISPCIFIPPLIVEPLLLEDRRHEKVERGSGWYSIFTSIQYAGFMFMKNCLQFCPSVDSSGVWPIWRKKMSLLWHGSDIVDIMKKKKIESCKYILTHLIWLLRVVLIISRTTTRGCTMYMEECQECSLRAAINTLHCALYTV